MPRKEGPPLEERMQRARELFEKKQKHKEETLRKLYSSRIYRYAKRTSILFLWVSQLILIDWALPYRQEKDVITGGYFNADTYNTKGIGGITNYKVNNLFIKTKKGYRFNTEFPDGNKEPGIGDSILVQKSFLIGDLKRMDVVRTNESFLICESVTYKFLPYIILFTAIAALFLFIRNIEVRLFAWLAFACTLSGSIFLIIYLALTYQ